MQNYHLVCVHPFGNYVKGQLVTDADEVTRLMGDRDHHFVRINAPAGYEESAHEAE